MQIIKQIIGSQLQEKLHKEQIYRHNEVAVFI